MKWNVVCHDKLRFIELTEYGLNEIWKVRQNYIFVHWNLLCGARNARGTTILSKSGIQSMSAKAPIEIDTYIVTFFMHQKMPFLVSIICIMLHVVWSMDCWPAARAFGALGEGYSAGKIDF
jgi:hypothetical protein